MSRLNAYVSGVRRYIVSRRDTARKYPLSIRLHKQLAARVSRATLTRVQPRNVNTSSTAIKKLPAAAPVKINYGYRTLLTLGRRLTFSWKKVVNFITEVTFQRVLHVQIGSTRLCRENTNLIQMRRVVAWKLDETADESHIARAASSGRK